MEKTNFNHKMICDNRKFLELTGIEKVESSNENQIVCKTMGTTLFVLGKNMHIGKLDVLQGTLQIDGQINLIKYQTSKKSFWKRIFK